jgi:hypothetical protein
MGLGFQRCLEDFSNSMEIRLTLITVVALCLGNVAVSAAQGRKGANEVHALIDAINSGDPKAIASHIDIQGILLSQEGAFLSSIGPSSAPAKGFSLSPIADGIQLIQSKPQENWSGIDLGIVGGQWSSVLRRTKKVREGKVKVPPELAFPTASLQALVDSKIAQSPRVRVDLLGTRSEKIKSTDRFIGLYSVLFRDALTFKVMGLEGGALVVEPAGSYLSVDVRIHGASEPPVEDQWYLRRVNGSWNVFGSSHGVLSYIPSVRVLRIPGGPNIFNMHHSVPFLEFWYRISPGNVTQMLGLGFG